MIGGILERSSNKKQSVCFIGSDARIKDEVTRLFKYRRFNFQTFDTADLFLKEFFHVQSDVVMIYVPVLEKSLLKLIRQIKDITDKTRIIILTDNPSEQLELKVRGYGIAYFAIWPEDQNYLTEVINAALITRVRETYTEVQFGIPHKNKGLMHEFSAC